MFEIIIVICFAHRREINHFWQPLLEFVGVAVNRGECAITRSDQFIVLVRCQIDIERHQAVVQKRIDRARRLNCELRIKLYRILQITQTLLQ